MVVYRVAVCDDNEPMLKITAASLEAAFRQLSSAVIIDCFAHPAALLRSVQVFKYDAVCLDISMPEMDGVELAKKLEELDAYISVIFISNLEDRVFDAQCVNPVRFVRKRSMDKELASAVAAMLKQKEQATVPKLHITVGETEKYIKIHDIMYVESFNNKQALVMQNCELQVYQSMKFFEGKLLHHGFIQIHRCYIVNYRFIQAFERNCVLLDNGKSLPISRLRIEECRKMFMKLVEEND